MLSRRQIMLSGAAAALATPALLRRARAAAFPERSVRVLVTTAPGGTSDIVARVTSNPVSERLGKPFIIDNRSGGGGVIAMMATKGEPADGHTLLAISRNNILSNLLYQNLDYDFVRDFEPVASLGMGGLLMLVNPSVPAKTLPEFIAFAKANPGKLNYGSAGKGTDPHLTAELFRMATGIEIAHVPYRGGAPALTDLLSGNIEIFFSNLPVSEYLATGKLRALGVTTAQRRQEYPDIPPIGEIVPGFEVGVWHGFVARRNSPPEAIRILNQAYNVALADPKVAAGIAPLGLTPAPMTPEDLGKYFASEIDKWGKVIKTQNIRLD